MTETQIEGKFWIDDLKKVLQEEGVFENDSDEDYDEEKAFERSLLWLPHKSKLKRWLKNEDPYHSISYCGPVIVNFKGYYDFSGRDVKVSNNTFNSFIPEDFPMRDSISTRIATENGIKSLNGGFFYGSDKPTNDLEEVRRQIRGINASREKIETCAKRLTDKLC